MNLFSFEGNVGQDPRLTFPDDSSKPARATFSVAITEGQGDNEKTHWINFTAFGSVATNVDKTIKKGMRVTGTARVNTYEKSVTVDGEEKTLTMVSFTVSSIGPDLRFATAEVTRNPRRNSSNDEGGEAPTPKAEAKQSAAKPAAADSDDF